MTEAKKGQLAFQRLRLVKNETSRGCHLRLGVPARGKSRMEGPRETVVGKIS